MADNQQFDDLKKQADQLNKRLESLGGTAAKNLDDFIKSFGGGIEGAKDAIFNLREQIKGVDTDVNYFAESLAKVTKELSKQTNFNTNIEKSYKSLSNLANELKNDQDLISRLDEKSLKSIEKKLEKEKASLLRNIDLNEERKQEILFQLRNNNLDLDSRQKLRKEFEAIKKVQSESNGFVTDQENGLNKLIKSAQDRLKYEQKINDRLGVSGNLVEGITNSLEKLGIHSKFFENIKEDMREAAEDAEKTKWDVFTTGLTSAFKGLKEGLKDPVTQLLLAKKAFEFFLNAAINANKESVNLSKNLGYGAANADRVRANFVDIEGSSRNLNVTTANLSEAFNELSTSTGFVSEYSADTLTTQIKLTKQLGLSGDEAAGVYKFSVLTGKSSEQTYQSLLKGYVATRNSLNVGIPFKAAIAEAAKVSGQLASNLGNNPETIIKAVVATRALGTSLEQAKNQGEKLLDFQSSIENELKAELITGQQLNLERARAAALMGDQVTVAEELASQGMTAAKFSGMNVIAQKSFAEALGTTSDELANQLAKREMAIASGKSLAQVTAEEAEEAAERQDIQEKFNTAMLKLQSIIGNLLAGPLGSFLDLLSGALEIINYFATPLKIIGGLFLGIYGTMQAINLVGKAIAITEGLTASIVGQKVGFQAASVASKVAENTASVFGNAQAVIGLATEGSSLSFKQLSLALEGKSLATKAIAYGWALKDMFVSRAKSMWEWATTGAQAGQLAKLPATIALKSAEAAITTETAVAATVAAEAASFGAATLWIVGGLAAVAGAMAMYAMKDGVVDPNKGPVMSGDFGSVQMDPNDKAMYGADGKIKVGTDLLGESKIDSIRSSPAMDISPMISAINQVTAAVTTLNNKSWDVKLDSKSVGSGLMQNSYRSA
jgi:hypothetical protein